MFDWTTGHGCLQNQQFDPSCKKLGRYLIWPQAPGPYLPHFHVMPYCLTLLLVLARILGPI